MPKKKMTKKELAKYKSDWVKKRQKLMKTVGVVRRQVRGGSYKTGTIKPKVSYVTKLAKYKADWVKKDRAKRYAQGLTLKKVGKHWKWIKKTSKVKRVSAKPSIAKYKADWVKRRAATRKSVGVVGKRIRGGKYLYGTTV